MRMRLSAVLSIGCLLVSLGCLIAAYAAIGRVTIGVGMSVLVLLWIATQKTSHSVAASGLLAVYFLLGVAGVLLQAPVLVIVLGCVAALAAWDLNDLRTTAETDPPDENGLEKHRLKALALATGVGLASASLATVIRLRLPFGVVALLVLLVLGCILYGVRSLVNPWSLTRELKGPTDRTSTGSEDS